MQKLELENLSYEIVDQTLKVKEQHQGLIRVGYIYINADKNIPIENISIQ